MKAFSPEQHKRVTAGIDDNAPVIAFCRRLAALKHPMWLRYVLVPGLTDIPEEMEQVARFAASLGRRRAGRNSPVPPDGPLQMGEARDRLQLSRHQPPSQEAVARAIGIFCAKGLTVC